MPRTKILKEKRDVPTPHAAAAFINSGQLRQRYGNVSAMWIVRTLANDQSFPKPYRLGAGRNRFWKLDELIKWERSVASRSRVA